MSKLLAVGTVAFDAIETPFGKTDKILGGSGTFVGLAASQFGVETGIVSVVGGDFPQEYLDMLAARNIDISGIEVVKGGKTFFWSGRYHNDMNSRDTLVTELNVAMRSYFSFSVTRNFNYGSCPLNVIKVKMLCISQPLSLLRMLTNPINNEELNSYD